MALWARTDVAASEDITGNSSQGGDWDLEYRKGIVEADVAFSADAQANWSGVLADVIHTSFESGAGEAEVKSDANWGQTFSYTSGGGTYEANFVSMQLRKDSDASSQNVTVELRTSWNGSVLGTATMSSDDLTTSMAWHKFNFSDVTLTDGTTYTIRIGTDTVDGKVFHEFNSLGGYAGGERLDTAGSPLSSEDTLFRVGPHLELGEI